MKTIIIVLITLFCAVPFVHADQLVRTEDSSGWTIFTPSDDSRIMYVAEGGAATGTNGIYDDDDALLNGTPMTPGAVLAYPTYAAAFANTRPNMPDWILFKRGDTFTENIDDDLRTGRSKTEPFLIGSYGSTGDIPLIKCDTSSDGIYINDDGSWMVFSNIELWSYTRDPNSPDFISLYTGSAGVNIHANNSGTIEGILLEGLVIRAFGGNIGLLEATGSELTGITVRRNTVLDSVSSASHAMGMWADDTDDLILEENIFDHNGWTIKQSLPGGSLMTDGMANSKNHNNYMTNITNGTFLRNINTRSSSIGNKFTSSSVSGPILIHNNLYIDNEVGIEIGNNYSGLYRFSDITITENVITDMGKSQVTNRVLGWGIMSSAWDGGSLSNNYILHQSNPLVTNGYGIEFRDTERNVVSSENVLFGLQNSNGVQFHDSATASTSMTFSDNIINIDTSSRYTLDAEYDISGIFTLTGNEYYSDKAAGERYRLDGSEITLSSFQSATGDTSVFADSTFPDDTRTVETYMVAQGETGTLDAFYLKIRAQNRYDWDELYTAEAVNEYIKAGFSAATVLCDGTHLYACDNVTDCANAGGDYRDEFCYPTPEIIVTDGVCGSNDGGTWTGLLSTDINNCSEGTVSAFTPTAWTCDGTGTADYCTASVAVTPSTGGTIYLKADGTYAYP